MPKPLPPPVTQDWRYPLVGWTLNTLEWIAYDLWATKWQDWRGRPRKPTMSQGIGHILAKPKEGPGIAGAGLGMVYHLLIEELLPAYWQKQQQQAASSGS
jgi:hypothetical protein